MWEYCLSYDYRFYRIKINKYFLIAFRECRANIIYIYINKKMYHYVWRKTKVTLKPSEPLLPYYGPPTTELFILINKNLSYLTRLGVFILINKVGINKEVSISINKVLFKTKITKERSLSKKKKKICQQSLSKTKFI